MAEPKAPLSVHAAEHPMPLPPAARMLRAAVLMRRAAARAGDVAHLLALAEADVQAALKDTGSTVRWDATTVRAGCELRRLEAQAAAERLPVLANAIALQALPLDGQPEGTVAQRETTEGGVS